MKTNLRKILTAGVAATLVSACAVNPKPISDEERLQRASADIEAMFADQEPLTGPVTLAEAMARSVKYNLDHRVKLMEEAVVRAEANTARMDLLPDMAVSAGYTDRSNIAASSSESVITGRQSLEPSTSQESERNLADATLVWNVLDFGISYVTAQQRADRILIAEEKRRKAVQNIIQDVRVAYWQALSASKLEKETDELLDKTRKALESSRAMQDKGLQPPMAAMQYQEGLLSTQRSLWQLRQNLLTSRTELASLMNIRPGTEFQLDPTGEELSAPEVNVPVNELEEFGLLHRPELIESDLKLRISSEEVRKEMLRMLPGIEINLGAHYDSNKYLVNNSWSQAGIRISWNLFNLFSGPARKDRAEAQVEVDKAQRLATGMAVITQTHVAYRRYLLAKKDLDLASTLLQVKSDIANEERARREANVSDELREIRARLDALVAQLQRDQALAELQNAVGRIHNSVGLNPLPKEVTGHDVATLTSAITTHQEVLKKIMIQPQLDPSVYDAKAAEVLAERRYRDALKAQEKALADKKAAEDAVAKAAAAEAERARAAEESAAGAKNAQQAVIAAAVAEAEAKRLAAEELTRLKTEAEARAAALEAARKASEAAAAAAAEAEQRRQAEAARIAAEVQAKLDAAVQAAVAAGAAKKAADEASERARSANQKLESIQVPEVPPKPESLQKKDDVISGAKKTSDVSPATEPVVEEKAPAVPERAEPPLPADPAPIATPAPVPPQEQANPASMAMNAPATTPVPGRWMYGPALVPQAVPVATSPQAPVMPVVSEQPATPAAAPVPEAAIPAETTTADLAPRPDASSTAEITDLDPFNTEEATIDATPEPGAPRPTEVTDLDPFNNRPLLAH